MEQLNLSAYSPSLLTVMLLFKKRGRSIAMEKKKQKEFSENSSFPLLRKYQQITAEMSSFLLSGRLKCRKKQSTTVVRNAKFAWNSQAVDIRISEIATSAMQFVGILSSQKSLPKFSKTNDYFFKKVLTILKLFSFIFLALLQLFPKVKFQNKCEICLNFLIARVVS